MEEYLIETLQKIKIREEKLKKAILFLEQRIEVIERKKREANLLQDFDDFLYIIKDVLGLSGDYPKEIEGRIEMSQKKEGEFQKEHYHDRSYVISELKMYLTRMKNDLFTEIFNEPESNKDNYYRMEPVMFTNSKRNPDYISIKAKNPLEAICDVYFRYGEFHLLEPEQDLIKINSCEFFKKYEKNKNVELRCSHYMVKGQCILANSVEREKCPNLENLIKYKIDFFEQVINGNYATIEFPLKA